MIARPPFLRPVEGTQIKRVSESSGGEDVIQLAGGGRRLLVVGMKCGNVTTVPWQFVRPRIGLAAVRIFRTDARQSHSLHPIKHSLVPGGPIDVAMFAVTAQDIQIAGGQNAMPVRLRNENRQVGNNVVNGTGGNLQRFTHEWDSDGVARVTNDGYDFLEDLTRKDGFRDQLQRHLELGVPIASAIAKVMAWLSDG